MTGIPLIPRAALFGNPSQFQARLSPDGEWLTWLAPFEGVLNVWLAPADQVAAATPLTRLKGRPIAWQDWARDGRHILFMRDRDGDENWHIFAVDRTTGVSLDLTPIDGVNARGRTSFNAISEAFLATHLGGCCEPFGSDLQGSSLEVREGIGVISGLQESLAQHSQGT